MRIFTNEGQACLYFINHKASVCVVSLKMHVDVIGLRVMLLSPSHTGSTAADENSSYKWTRCSQRRLQSLCSNPVNLKYMAE